MWREGGGITFQSAAVAASMEGGTSPGPPVACSFGAAAGQRGAWDCCCQGGVLGGALTGAPCPAALLQATPPTSSCMSSCPARQTRGTGSCAAWPCWLSSATEAELASNGVRAAGQGCGSACDVRVLLGTRVWGVRGARSDASWPGQRTHWLAVGRAPQRRSTAQVLTCCNKAWHGCPARARARSQANQHSHHHSGIFGLHTFGCRRLTRLLACWLLAAGERGHLQRGDLVHIHALQSPLCPGALRAVRIRHHDRGVAGRLVHADRLHARALHKGLDPGCPPRCRQVVDAHRHAAAGRVAARCLLRPFALDCWLLLLPRCLCRLPCRLRRCLLWGLAAAGLWWRGAASCVGCHSRLSWPLQRGEETSHRGVSGWSSVAPGWCKRGFVGASAGGTPP